MFDISALKEMKLAELQEIAKAAKTIKFNGVKKEALISQILELQSANTDSTSDNKKLEIIAEEYKPKRARIVAPKKVAIQKSSNTSLFSDEETTAATAPPVMEKEMEEDSRVYNKGKKPLLESYLKNDYRNKFLIPIVLDRKKLYFPNEVSDYHYEFYTSNSNILNKNQQQVINDVINMIEQKASSKISSVTYFQLEKGINETMKPYKVNDDSKMIPSSTSFCALIYMAPSSASAADDVTPLIISVTL